MLLTKRQNKRKYNIANVNFNMKNPIIYKFWTNKIGSGIAPPYTGGRQQKKTATYNGHGLFMK